MTQPIARPTARRRRTAFSLVELMISTALALILLLGVNYVFRTTQQTVSTGMALSSQVRLQQGASDTIRNDFRSAVAASQQPVIAIHSYGVYAYRDRQDQQNDKDGNVLTADLTGEGAESAVPTLSPSSRYHRVDTLSFFARGKFRRQTGQPAPGSSVLVSDMTASEAWIWYGHAALPEKDLNPPTLANPYYGPGEPESATADVNQAAYITTPNDYTGAYAANRTLARQSVLLVAPDESTGEIYDNNGEEQVFFFQDPSPAGNIYDDSLLWPLAYNARSTTDADDSGKSGGQRLQFSTYDLAGTDITTYYERLEAETDPADTATYAGDDWWTSLIYQRTTDPDPYPEFRFAVNAFPKIAGATQAEWPLEMARTTPALLRGCTQFIVEFAGDFLNQDPNNGSVLAPASPTSPGDGVVDFIVTNTTTNERQVRWYGARRDVARGNPAGGTYAATPDNTYTPAIDIGPISDVPGYNTAYGYHVAADGFEREIPSGGRNRYSFVWGPNDPVKPSMIRITIELTDPRLPEPRVEQYIMTLD